MTIPDCVSLEMQMADSRIMAIQEASGFRLKQIWRQLNE